MSSSPLDVVVRFSTSAPDVSISIADPKHFSILSLKRDIRAELQSNTRLRLIHAGKVLADRDAVSKSLGSVAAPPRQDDRKSDKARGKQAVREPAAVRVYIHCSVGDELSQVDLETEKGEAERADAALVKDEIARAPRIEIETTASTTPSPQGFDRLLTAGFTAAEVASLRTQFLAIQSHTHTPDTMPTGADLLALEERWLEQPNANNGGAGGPDDLGGEDGLEDMLWGSLIGFFWPVGVMCWLMREDGVWSRRRQIMVLLGFFINLMFGFLRLIA